MDLGHRRLSDAISLAAMAIVVVNTTGPTRAGIGTSGRPSSEFSDAAVAF